MNLGASEADRMIVEAAREMTRQRRRLGLIALSLLGLVALGVVVAFLMRERTVMLIGPEGEAVRLELEGDRVRIPPRGQVVTRLRPGSHAVRVEGAKQPRSVLHVSPFDRSTVFVPLTEDQCFIDASAGALYGDSPAPPTVFSITRPGQTVSSGSGLFNDDVVVADICEIPYARTLMSQVHVVEAIRCSDAPVTREAASTLLLERLVTCRLSKRSLDR